MRVLHIHSGNLYGGVETLLATLARLRHYAPDLEQHFGLCFAGRLSKEIGAEGAPLHWLGEVQTRRPWGVFQARRSLAKLLVEQKFDAAICHAVWPQALFGPAVRRAGRKLFFWQHDTLTGRHWLERWARHTPPDFVISNSRHTAMTLQRVFPQSAQEVMCCPVAPCAVSLALDEKRAVRKECQTEAASTVIIQVSRLEEWKGHRLHLAALGLLRDLPGWTAWFVGGAQRPHEETYLCELKAEVEHLGISEKVRFLGQRDDVPRLLAAADIFCQPNTGPEPFGIVFIEALYAGLPVVATDIGGASEIVDKTCGVLTPPYDAKALAAALRGLLNQPERRRHFAQNAPARAAALCDPVQQIAGLVKLLQKAGPQTMRVYAEQ